MNEVFIPVNRRGWWGGEDTRPRCPMDDKVAFSQEKAEESAAKIRARASEWNDNHLMTAYKGKCGNWHVGHSKLTHKRTLNQM